MHILHTNHGLDFDELYALVRGKVIWNKCKSCDASGMQYYDGKTGEGLSKSLSKSHSGIDVEWLECEDCGGLGYKLYKE